MDGMRPASPSQLLAEQDKNYNLKRLYRIATVNLIVIDMMTFSAEVPVKRLLI